MATPPPPVFTVPAVPLLRPGALTPAAPPPDPPDPFGPFQEEPPPPPARVTEEPVIELAVPAPPLPAVVPDA